MYAQKKFQEKGRRAHVQKLNVESEKALLTTEEKKKNPQSIHSSSTTPHQHQHQHQHQLQLGYQRHSPLLSASAISPVHASGGSGGGGGGGMMGMKFTPKLSTPVGFFRGAPASVEQSQQQLHTHYQQPPLAY